MSHVYLLSLRRPECLSQPGDPLALPLGLLILPKAALRDGRIRRRIGGKRDQANFRNLDVEQFAHGQPGIGEPTILARAKADAGTLDVAASDQHQRIAAGLCLRRQNRKRQTAASARNCNVAGVRPSTAPGSWLYSATTSPVSDRVTAAGVTVSTKPPRSLDRELKGIATPTMRAPSARISNAERRSKSE